MKSLGLTFLLMMSLTAGAQGLDSQEITIPELKHYISQFAADSMAGRVAGSDEYEQCARIAASEFQAMGLSSFFGPEETGFLQPVPFQEKKKKDRNELSVHLADKTLTLVENKHFRMRAFNACDFPDGPLPLVFVGLGISEPDQGWDDLKGLALEEKIALMLMQMPEDDESPLPEAVQRRYSHAQSANERTETLFKRGARGVMLIASRHLESDWNRIPGPHRYSSLVYTGGSLWKGGGKYTQLMRLNRLFIKKSVAKKILIESGFNPQNPDWSRYRPGELANISVQYQSGCSGNSHTEWNVVGMVPGTDPDLKGEYIVVGAHLDHIAPKNGNICNGADDNASGCAGVLEAAEAVMAHPTKRSVIFVLYAAEEIGLLGARHFLNACPVDWETIRLNINLDMIGRSGDGYENTRHHYFIYADENRSNWARVIRTINRENVQWPLIVSKQKEMKILGDHLNFAEIGIPACTFFSGFHSDLHRPTDDEAYIDYDKAQKITTLVYDMVQELGNREKIWR